MADVTLIPRVANFSHRLQKNFTTTTAASVSTTVLDTDKADLYTFKGSYTTAPTLAIVLPPILNNVRAIKVNIAGMLLDSASGGTVTLTPGQNQDTFALDTINGTTSYVLTPVSGATTGLAVVIESEITHNWKVFVV